MEPESEAKDTDLVGTEVSNDEAAEEIRWIGDAQHSGHGAVEDRSNGDDTTGADAIDENGNGATTNVEQLELGGSAEHDDDTDDTDDTDDNDDNDKTTGAETSHRGPELITISGGVVGDDASDISRFVSRETVTGGSQDLNAWDDEDWDDDEWDDDAEVATDRYAHTAVRPEHLTLTDVLRVRSARFLAITMVVTFVAVVMATVLLWQRVEDTRAEVHRSKQVTSVPGLASVNRRLNRLETEIAAILGSPSGDPTHRADAIQQQLTALNQCVADFQHAIVSGKRSAVRYC